MLNLKKGLAVVLAAATALTFAPVANLGNAVQAEAATNSLINQTQNIPLTAGTGSGGSHVDLVANLPYTTTSETSSTPFKVTVSGDDVVSINTVASGSAIAYTAGRAVADGTVFRFTAKDNVTGSETINWSYPSQNDSSVEVKGSFVIEVKAPSSAPVFQITNASAAAGLTSGTAAAINPWSQKKGQVGRLSLGSTANGAAYTITHIVSSDPSIVEVTTDETTPGTNVLTYKKAGTVTLTVTLSNADGKGKAGDYKVSLTVIADKSTFKIGDKEISTATSADVAPVLPTSTVAGNIAKTIYLTASAPTAKIGATLADPRYDGEKILYKAFKESSSSAVVASETSGSANTTNEITVSDDGTITATANALNATEQYYFVRVAVDENNDNSLAATNDKIGWVRVITTRQDKAFSDLKVTLEGKDYEAKASYDESGNVKDSTNSDAKLTLSTVDKTTVPFTVTSTNQYEVKSNDSTTVAVENGNLVAKKVGPATITISTKADTTHYGAATVTISVTVDNRMLNAKVVAVPATINLNKVTKTAKIAASVVTTPALTTQPTLSYQFVTKNADGTYTKASSADLDLAADGTLTYKTTNKGSAIVEVSAPATQQYTAPAKAYVTVNYTSEKAASQLKVDQTAVNVAAGETATVAATGTAITVKSSDDAVATASYADGKVSVVGVKKGVAVVTVTDAGNDNYEGSSAQIVVYVAGAKMTKPAKVTGVKVTNLKGGKVKVTWTKVGTNPNVKYYVKKTVNGKSAGKSVNGTKTTLTVKKGATVKVKVKAYIYDENNEKYVGSYSSTVSKKTDKK